MGDGDEDYTPISVNVKSFERLEYFTALQELKIYKFNPLNDTINLVNKAVTYIAISGADEHLKTLDINGCINLKKLVIHNNTLLTDINLKGFIKLDSLSIINNEKLTSLDLSHNTALEELSCEYNQLTKLDVSHNTALKKLYCASNDKITSLDLSQNTKLEYLDCSSNKLKKLDLSHNTDLNDLICYSNNLKVLDLSNNPQLTKDYVYADKGVKIIWYGTKKTKTTKGKGGQKTPSAGSKSKSSETTTKKEKETTAAKTSTKKKPETKKKTTTKAGTTKKPEVAKNSKVVIKTIEELYAPIKVPDFKGTTKTSLIEAFEVINHFTKFDFATGKTVAQDSNEWDVAFARQFVIINGGQKMQACTDAAKSALEETASDLSTTLSCTVDAAQSERTGNAAAFMFDYTSFDKVKDVKNVKWRQDTANEQAIEEKDITETMQSDPKGFFEFSLSPPAYTLIPFKNATAVFRTKDGKHYVKMQALNCYKGQPKPAKVPSMSPNFGYWTFILL